MKSTEEEEYQKALEILNDKIADEIDSRDHNLYVEHEEIAAQFCQFEIDKYQLIKKVLEREHNKNGK